MTFAAAPIWRRTGPLLALVTALAAGPAAAQWSQVYDQVYLPASHNWAFRGNYPGADRLFNAFDYGHAILYEKLYTKPNAPVSELEEKEYDFITRELLVHPPRVPLEEAAIEVAYAKLAPEAKAMFDWAHLLHRQIYDVWADDRIQPAEKDARIAELLRYYKSRPDLAFSSSPKTMELMEGQPYSLAFRRKYPKFNGLIWAYHWLQVGLYEPLLTGQTAEDRQTGVTAAVARFRQMLENPPHSMPYIMPMTAAIAPTFAARYPEAAIIFDNLHSMHDVVSDILTSPTVSKKEKRAELLKAAARYRDATSFVMTPEEWRSMAQMMGINNMGGPAVGFVEALPTPTVPLGASMVGMGGMADSTAAMDPMSGMAHMPGMTDSMPGMHAGEAGGMPDSMGGMGGHRTTRGSDSMPAMGRGEMGGKRMSDERMRQMMQMQESMMADPVIRERMMADTAMRRLMREMREHMPTEHRDSVARMRGEPPAHREHHDSSSDVGTPAHQSPAAKSPDTAAPAKGQPMDSMPGMDHGRMPSTSKP